MAKNEAKVKFSAETSEFNENIKRSNAEMAKLRAEMKQNDEQMKATGVSVEGLQQRQKLLGEQLDASRQKTEALSQKVEKAKEIYGENSTEVMKLQTQLITAQTAELKLERQIASCNDEIDRQRAAADRTETETEKLTDTIDKQKRALGKLKDEYTEAVLKYGENSDEAKALAGEIDELSGELKLNTIKMEEAKRAADELDRSLKKLDDGAEEAEDGFTVLKGVVASLAADAITGAIGKMGEFIGYLADLPRETMELRQDFGTLETAFGNVGFSAETATKTWKDLYRVFGEDDRAVEAANNIARMAKNEQELNDWVTITTGIWGTYQDALPVEGLAEAAGETA